MRWIDPERKSEKVVLHDDETRSYGSHRKNRADADQSSSVRIKNVCLFTLLPECLLVYLRRRRREERRALKPLRLLSIATFLLNKLFLNPMTLSRWMEKQMSIRNPEDGGNGTTQLQSADGSELVSFIQKNCTRFIIISLVVCVLVNQSGRGKSFWVHFACHENRQVSLTSWYNKRIILHFSLYLCVKYLRNFCRHLKKK
jgi:hypothetical protein